jgi:hypothetical protein
MTTSKAYFTVKKGAVKDAALKEINLLRPLNQAELAPNQRRLSFAENGMASQFKP